LTLTVIVTPWMSPLKLGILLSNLTFGGRAWKSSLLGGGGREFLEGFDWVGRCEHVCIQTIENEGWMTEWVTAERSGRLCRGQIGKWLKKGKKKNATRGSPWAGKPSRHKDIMIKRSKNRY